MSQVTIPQHRVDAFRDNLRHLAQQVGSKLRQYTDYWSPEAETGAWDRMSDGDMAPKTRNAGGNATPETGRVHTRRIAIASPWDDGELIEAEDPSMMLIDPKSNIVQSMGYAAGRQIDDVIIAAATGNATSIDRDQPHTGAKTPTPVPLPAQNWVGDGTTPITFDMVTEVQERFTANDIGPEVPKIFVIGPRQLRELMNLTEVTSADYVDLRQLQQYGMAPNWLGFNWVLSTRLLNRTQGEDDGTLAPFAMTYDAVGLHMPMEGEAFCERDPSRSYAWRPYFLMNLGAVRVEDRKVVGLDVLDPTNGGVRTPEA